MLSKLGTQYQRNCDSVLPIFTPDFCPFFALFHPFLKRRFDNLKRFCYTESVSEEKSLYFNFEENGAGVFSLRGKRLHHGRADERTERFTLLLTQTACESVWWTPSGGVLLTQTVCEKCVEGLVWMCVDDLTDACCARKGAGEERRVWRASDTLRVKSVW